MTARWRTVLRVRSLVRLLIEKHVPVGTLGDLVEQLGKVPDGALVDSEARNPSFAAGMAAQFVGALLGDDVELIDRDAQPELRPPRDTLQAARDLLQLWLRQLHKAAPVNATEDAYRIAPVILSLDVLLRGDELEPPRPPGEPRDLLRIADELRRRRQARSRAAEVAGGDRDRDAQDEHAAVLLELDELLAFVLPLQGAPLPELEKFGQFLAGERFYQVMQDYRHASLVPQGEVAERFEAVKAALIEAVRR